jgi:hypothetical protein
VAVASATGTTVIDDTFNRAPSTTLGNGWQEVQGDLVISNNELRNALAPGTHSAVQPTFTGTRLTAAASFASPNNTPSPRFGLILRYQGPGNYYKLYRQTGGTNALRIAKVVNGVEALLKSAAAPGIPLNTFFRLTATATVTSGVTTLTLSLGGGGSVSVQDSTFSGGAVGIMLYSGSNDLNQYRADDFHAERN